MVKETEAAEYAVYQHSRLPGAGVTDEWYEEHDQLIQACRFCRKRDDAQQLTAGAPTYRDALRAIAALSNRPTEDDGQRLARAIALAQAALA